jgi:hypothetical protein
MANPRLFARCIARFLEEEYDDEISTELHADQSYESLYTPEIHMANYVQRMFSLGNISPVTVLVALVYIQRIKRCIDTPPLRATSVHRMFAATLCIAIKFLEDECYSTGWYARLFGISSRELSYLERHTLERLGYSLFVGHRDVYDVTLNVLSAGQDIALRLSSDGAPIESVCRRSM